MYITDKTSVIISYSVYAYIWKQLYVVSLFVMYEVPYPYVVLYLPVWYLCSVERQYN